MPFLSFGMEGGVGTRSDGRGAGELLWTVLTIEKEIQNQSDNIGDEKHRRLTEQDGTGHWTLPHQQLLHYS